jgi:hypothetical protein
MKELSAEILSALVQAHPRPMTQLALVAWVWQGFPPKTAGTAIRVVIWRLRRLGHPIETLQDPHRGFSGYVLGSRWETPRPTWKPATPGKRRAKNEIATPAPAAHPGRSE